MSFRRLRRLWKSAAPRLFPYSQAKIVKKLIIPTKPRVTKYQSISLANRLFSLQTSRSTACVIELGSYKDRNFLIKGAVAAEPAPGSTKKRENEEVYVFKVLNSVCSRNPNLIRTISDLLFFLNSNGIQCPVPQASIFGTYHVSCRLLKKRFDGDILDSPETPQDKDSCDAFELVSDVVREMEDVYIFRMFSFLPGKMLCDELVKWSPTLLVNIGAKIANMHKFFKEFSESKSSRSLERLRGPFEWDIRNFPDVVDLCFHAFDDDVEKQITLKEIVGQFQNDVLPNIGKLDQQLIHGDLNAHNILVGPNIEENDLQIQGFIDFDHLHYSSRVIDVAIALSYIMLESESKGLDTIEAANHMLAGYQSELPLSDLELGMILKIVMARICLSLSMGAYNYMYNSDLDRDYVLYTAKRGWRVIDHLLKLDPDVVRIFHYEKTGITNIKVRY